MSLKLSQSRFLPGALVALIFAAGAAILSAQMSPSADAAPPAKAPSRPAPQPAAPAWKPATAAQRTGAATSIRAQLNAFKSGQWDKAITYQSSTLKGNFPSTAAFKQMMQRSYPQFIRYKTIEFGPARAAGPIVQIAVKLTGTDGVVVSAIYIMQKEKGVYRVEGVTGGVAPDRATGNIV